MLSPRYLAGLSDDLIEIYSQLEIDILRDMARRLARVGKITETTEWQMRVLAEAGGLRQDIAHILHKYDRQIVQEIQAIFTDAMLKNAEADNRVFEQMTGRTISDSQAQMMLATIQKTHSDLSRLTMTTAETTNTQFIQQANAAYMKVSSGAFDYNTAMKQAADDIAQDGVTTWVTYNNTKPVRRSIESAVRMNILTGVNHTAAAMTINNCEQLACDLVEVTAHIGARPEHEEWQGKIYSVSGKSEKYPPFSVCGYGDADGICGINCRHSFYPYFEGMEQHYSQDDLDEMSKETVSYNGKSYSRYEGEQQLRRIERTIRSYKKEAAVQEAAGIDNTAARCKIGEWQQRARDFTKQTGIRRDRAREYIGMPNGEKQPLAIPAHKADTYISKPAITSAVHAVKAFPNEKWNEINSSIFVAESRKPVNKEQKKVYEKELNMAKIAGKHGHTVYMLPEKGKGKNCDVIMDGVLTEFKKVTGGENAISHRFRESLKQGKNTFLEIKRDISATRVKQILHGVIKDNKNASGTVYCYLNGILYKWNMNSLK